MRRIAILFLLFPLKLSAQEEWAPIGAKWYYQVPAGQYTALVTLEVKKDSVIEGKNVRVLDVNYNLSGDVDYLGEEYIHQDGNKIFYYNANHRAFYLLYDFDAKVGDTVWVHTTQFKPTPAFLSFYDSIYKFDYVIKAVDSILISGRWFKRQVIDNSYMLISWNFAEPNVGREYYIIEKFGSLSYFFGISGHSYPEAVPHFLRCYRDGTVQYTDPAWTDSCDYVSVASTKNDYVKVSPNPFNEVLNIEAREQLQLVELFSIEGIRLQTYRPFSNRFELRSFHLAKGVYILKIKTPHRHYLKKVVKR